MRRQYFLQPLFLLAFCMSPSLGKRWPDGSRSCNSSSYLQPQHPDVPCIHVPSCAAGTSSLTLSSTSDGRQTEGKKQCKLNRNHVCSNCIVPDLALISYIPVQTRVDLCYSEIGFQFSYFSYNETYFRNDHSGCNAPFYLQEVVEVFIAQQIEDPHQYTEIEASVNGGLFAAHIDNPTGRSASGHTYINCTTSGIDVKVIHNEDVGEWVAHVVVPFTVAGRTPLPPAITRIGEIWRMNFFRVRMRSSVDVCHPSSCDYLSWSPTLAVPPNFHISPYFGIIILE